MTALRRLKPYCQIGLWLVVFLGAVDLALTGLTATPVLSWLPKMVAGAGYLEDNRERVSNAVREFHSGQLPAEHVGAIIGISNVRQGVDVGVMTAAVGADWRFLGLGGAGLGISDIRQYSDLLLATDLRPRVVLIGLGLHQLVDTRPRPAAARVGAVGYLRRGEWRNAAGEIRSSSWLYSRQQDVSLTVERALLDMRAGLFSRWHVNLPRHEADHRSPWRDMLKSDWPDHFSAATLVEEEKFFRDLGVFQISTYTNSSKATSALIDICGRFRERGARVVIVLMPEHSTLSGQIPTEALQLFETRLNNASPDGAPPILDFRQSLDDSQFVDLVHLNKGGSARFSRTLGERVRRYLSTTKPEVLNGSNGKRVQIFHPAA
jgi:hypothetical protein